VGGGREGAGGGASQKTEGRKYTSYRQHKQTVWSSHWQRPVFGAEFADRCNATGVCVIVKKLRRKTQIE